MKQRAITAFFFAAAMLAGIYGGKSAFFLLFGVITAGCLWELAGLLFATPEVHLKTRKWIATTSGVAAYGWIGWILLFGPDAPELPGGLPPSLVLNTIGLMTVALGLLVCLLFCLELWLAATRPFAQIGHYLVGVFYVVLPFILLVSMSCIGNTYHPNRVFGLLWLVWTNDTLAYLVGSRMGKTKLFERISPKKTWEGTLGGIAGTILMAWGIGQFLPDFQPTQWLALGVVVSIFGTIGDLVESMLKRSAGVKDSGRLFPGHGGFLDRFDAFLFMLPFAWLAVALAGG